MTTQPSIDQLIARLRALMPEIEARFHVERVALFGSYVHADQTPESDLDVLVSFSEVPSLLRFIELEDFLADSLDIKVDLVMEDALKPSIGRRIRNDLVPRMTGPRDYQDYLAEMLEAADKVAGMRDKLVHDYFGVNTQVVWKTAVEDVPAIAAALREVGP